MPHPVSAGQSFPSTESHQFLMSLGEDVNADGTIRFHSASCVCLDTRTRCCCVAGEKPAAGAQGTHPGDQRRDFGAVWGYSLLLKCCCSGPWGTPFSLEQIPHRPMAVLFHLAIHSRSRMWLFADSQTCGPGWCSWGLGRQRAALRAGGHRGVLVRVQLASVSLCSLEKSSSRSFSFR